MMRLTKNLPFLALILSLFIYTGCKDLDFTQFEIDYNTEYTYKAGLGTAIPFTTKTPEIQSNSSSKFSANDTRKDKVEEINLQSMTLTIQSPDGANFNFLNEISISIDTDGLDEVVIASKSNIPEGSSTIEMDVNGSMNLKEYVTNDEFVFTTTTKTDETVNQDITVKIKSVFFVDAKVI